MTRSHRHRDPGRHRTRGVPIPRGGYHL